MTTQLQTDPPDVLERRFDDAMMEIYELARDEVGYRATRYLQMLRRRGGLGTAKELLRAKTTSEGYAQLRDAGRLDLTVEAYVLRPEFASLFSEEELRRARERLALEERIMLEERSTHDPVDAELADLLEQVAGALPADKIAYRDRVAAFGPGAIPVLVDWVAAGNSPGFGCGAIEAIGRRGSTDVAIRALERLRRREPGWAAFIGEAIARLEALRTG